MCWLTGFPAQDYTGRKAFQKPIFSRSIRSLSRVWTDMNKNYPQPGSVWSRFGPVRNAEIKNAPSKTGHFPIHHFIQLTNDFVFRGGKTFPKPVGKPGKGGPFRKDNPGINPGGR
jgi:hypothetical protein